MGHVFGHRCCEIRAVSAVACVVVSPSSLLHAPLRAVRPLFLLCTSPTWHTQAGSRPASLRARVSKPFEFEARSTASNSLSSLHFPHSPRPYRCPPCPLYLVAPSHSVAPLPRNNAKPNLFYSWYLLCPPDLSLLQPPNFRPPSSPVDSRYRKSAFSPALRSISALLPLAATLQVVGLFSLFLSLSPPFRFQRLHPSSNFVAMTFYFVGDPFSLRSTALATYSLSISLPFPPLPPAAPAVPSFRFRSSHKRSFR